MSPGEAGRELARAVATVRSVGRSIALWRSAVIGIPVLALLSVAGWMPDGWLSRPGSIIPMLLAVTGLVLIGTAGLAAGASVRSFQLRRRAAEIETAQGLARGDLLGAIELGSGPGDSGGLSDLHRQRVAAALEGRSARELLPTSCGSLRAARRLALPGVGVVLAVLGLGLSEKPVSAARALGILARPWAATFPPAPPPLRLDPPGGEVLRGGAFEVVVSAVGRDQVRLGQAGSGTPTRRTVLDVLGGAAVARIEPVDERIRFWAEDDRGSTTDTFTVVPVDPLTITSLLIELDYPRYLSRPRELLSGPVNSLQVPFGTRLGLTARTNHPIERMGLTRTRDGEATADTLDLEVAADMARGALTAERSELLSWWMVASPSVPDVRVPPAITLSVTEDAPPTVVLVYPGEDRTLGIERALSLVIEAKDDYGLGEVGLVWWRESTGGRTDPPTRERLAEGSGARRLTLRPTIDFESAGFLPGDEIVYFATARDSNPRAPASVSDTFRARLASLEELTDEIVHRTGGLVEEARSVRDNVGDLSGGARDAERRSRGGDEDSRQADAAPDRADFGATRESRDLLGEAREVEAQLTRMREDLGDLGAGLDAAVFTDPDLRQRIQELEELYREILDSGLRDRIEALEEALRGLDRDDLRDALSDLSRQTADIEEQLDRALGLMERVALEQSLEGARQTAEDLADRQEQASVSNRLDEAWADRQERQAAESEALAGQVDDLSDRLEAQQAPEGAERAREAAEDARSAASRMRSAARRTSGDSESSGSRSAQEAKSAAAELEQAERNLAAAGEALTEDWRSEAMKVVERAAAETLELAREQERIVKRLRSGDRSEDLSASQSAVREGLDNLSQSLAEAGRQTALMDRRTGPAAARAGREMDALGQSISGGAARRNDAVQEGESAIQALADLASSLLASGRAMAEASSATGMEEALDRLAGMGKRQAGLNSESGELFLLMREGRSGDDQLSELSARQAGISRELLDLAADPAARELGSRPEELSAEADEIARRLMTETLDRETLSRQERLFQRLLDAGRSLEKDEEEARRRQATTARPRAVLVPNEDAGIVAGPRYPYPDAEDMEGLTASQRRMVYEYFDRLNAGNPEDQP